MAGYIGKSQGVTQVDGYNRSEADAEFVQVTGDTMTGALVGTDLTLSGGVYLGGTGAANLLDDYEEGTWTPVLSFGGTAATTTFNATTYTKTGRIVVCNMELYVSNLNGGTGVFAIGGLPFTNASLRSAQGQFYFQFMNSTFPAGDKFAFINADNTTLNVSYFTGSSGTAVGLSDTHFTTSSYVYATFVYNTN